ncbi:MAG: UDP-N-acetylmuramate--L-alanine ligase [Lewinella sp.]|nr:UDP-N-acetylmuramate--L-alanine ligase [Lewinella sp.]
MKLQNNYQQVYFLGIGGIGMSALARYFHHRGLAVSGYDKTETPLTQALAAEGMTIHYQPAPGQLPPQETTLFIYTPAVPADFPELLALQQRGDQVWKRSEVLGFISEDQQTVAIAGTHGKTTTTTLTAHLMRECGIDASAFLGGISRNFKGNYVHGAANWVVAEADEYDRSFLRLHPQLAVILSMDADHLDIYGDHENLLETGFRAFARQVAPSGCLLLRHDLLPHFAGFSTTRVKTFSLQIAQADYWAEHIRVEGGQFVFDFYGPQGLCLPTLRLPLPGRHNVENAMAAIALTLEAGGEAQRVASALAAFQGIGRRFETVLQTEEVVIIDDYAHHPTELAAAIGAARELYPNRRLRGVFQPHLYSRTQDFAAGFAAALDLLDEPILLPIYPAREKPRPGVDSGLLLQLMTNPAKKLVTKSELLPTLAAGGGGVVLLLGAGDIDALVTPVVEHYQKIFHHD